MKLVFWSLSAFSVLIFNASLSHGQATTINSGNWGTATNWSTNAVPTATTQVIVAHPMTLNQNLSVQAKYIFNAASSGSQGINMSADSLITNANVSITGGGNNLTGGVILVKSGYTFTIGGFATGGSFKLVIEPGATVIVNGSINNNGGTFQVDGTLTVNGSYSAANSSGTVTGGGTFTTTGGMTSMNGGTIFGNPNKSCSSNCNGNSLCGTTATITPLSASLCLGKTLSFSSSVTPAPTTYEWQSSTTPSNFTAIATATSDAYSHIPSASAYYRLKVINSSCITYSSPVFITVQALPSVPTAPAVARCGPGTLTLQATGSTGTYSWYDDVTGLNLVSATSNYTTGTLSASTDYYVEAVDNSTTCKSAMAMVNAAINTIPSAPTASDAMRCGPGTVTLTATGSGGTYHWYQDALASISLFEGSDTYTSPSLSSSAAYYVSSLEDGCESDLTLVNVTVETCTGIDASTETAETNVYVSEKTLFVHASQTVSELNIYNTQGQLMPVNFFSQNQQETQASLASMQPGVYMLRFKIGNEPVSRKVVME